MIKLLFRNLLIIISLGVIYFISNTSCAKVGAPTGGLKDTIPPKILASIPENYSTKFNKKKIEIAFDEYLQLKNLNDELVVSPPLKKTPNILIRYKSVNINIEDTLKEDVTYTIDFGNAIVDNNESNPLENYQYVFSTGEKIDSLRVTGFIQNAFNLKSPENRIYVMLYDNVADSAPHTIIPSYITKTKKDGSYSIKNVREGLYKLFALYDVNSNLLFDLPNEQIAFADTPVYLNANKIVQDATIKLDSSLVNDTTLFTDSTSVLNDSIIALEKHVTRTYGLHANLMLFEEDVYNQFLIKESRESKFKLQYIFNEKYTDSLQINLLNDSLKPNNWYLKEPQANGDTIDIWIIDSTVYQQDTIWTVTGFTFTDSLNNNVIKFDTLKFALKNRKKLRNKNENIDDESAVIENIKLSFNVSNNGILDINKALTISNSTPILNWDTSFIKLTIKKDTLFLPKQFDISQSTQNKRVFHLNHDWETEANYNITFYPGAFTDYYSATNDTIMLNYRIQKEEFYGILYTNLKGIYSPVIIQLLDEKENIVKEGYYDTDSRITYEYLHPKKYLLKLIMDKNNNKKWDTGNYDEHIQPEEVLYYDGNITIKSNWELEINWDLSDK